MDAQCRESGAHGESPDAAGGICRRLLNLRVGGEAAEEARGGDLSPLALRHSWYRIMTPRRVKPSPIMPMTIRTGSGSLRALIERQSFHLIPACSHSALVVGISAATTGVANATARFRATIEAMIFILRHRRLGLFSFAGTGAHFVSMCP